jgi:hypothetical protein
MGHWAQSRRRGGAREFGLLPAPTDTDWTWGQSGPTTLLAHRTVDTPPPATAWRLRWRDVINIPWTETGATGSADITVTGRTTGHTYEGQVLWYGTAGALSPWSASKLHTLAP